MSDKATTADAQVILQLYDLRREEVMRKAREFVGLKFWPKSADEYMKVGMGMGPEGAYLRQVISYWEMAATLAENGAVNAKLFNETAGEMYFVFAKLRPILKDMRKTFPDFLVHVEAVINAYPGSQDRLDRIAAMQERLMAAQSTSAGR